MQKCLLWPKPYKSKYLSMTGAAWFELKESQRWKKRNGMKEKYWTKNLALKTKKMYVIEIVHKKIWVSIFVVIEKYGIVALNLRQTKV